MILSTEIGSLRKRVGERKCIEMLASVGFDALDYSFTPDMERGITPWNRDDYRGYAKELLKIAQDNGVYFNQAHAPFLFSAEEFENYEERILPMNIRCLEICALLGIPHMVIHPLHYLDYRQHKERLWELNYEYYRKMLPYAKETGVKIALENMILFDEYKGRMIPDFLGDAQEYIAFLRELNAPEFVCCIDTGHCAFSNQNVGEVLRKMGKRVHALHVNDNRYKKDDHLVPGMGCIDWSSCMEALAEIGYQGDITFEALNHYQAYDDDFLMTAAKYLHDVGRYLIKKVENGMKKTGNDS